MFWFSVVIRTKFSMHHPNIFVAIAETEKWLKVDSGYCLTNKNNQFNYEEWPSGYGARFPIQ